jgi:four helix bundle protein
MQNAKRGIMSDANAKIKPRKIQERAFDFACRIVKLCDHLFTLDPTSRRIAGQLLRSGTSIGANMEEAEAAQTKRDFIAKCRISLKEARETRYWLRLLMAGNKVADTKLQPLAQECEEIMNIIGAIVRNSTKNLEQGK